jgi:protein-tyrosine phosphatase
MSSRSARAEVFSIVFVCTANRFRSPLAAAVLTQELPDGLPVGIFSRGTLDVGAMPPLTQALDAATRLGVDVSRHRARRLDTDDLVAAGLVIGFESGHLEAAHQAGASPHAVFGLEDIVELLERLDRRPTLKNYASSLRHTVTAASRLQDPQSPTQEIEDPVGKSFDEGVAIARQIHSLTVRLARLLSP